MFLRSPQSLQPLKFWKYLIGTHNGFPVEHRIYNALCILSLIAIGYNIAFNFVVGLVASAAISIILLVIVSGLFYLARRMKKLGICIPLSAIVINGLFAVNYFYNAGISGPTLLLFGSSALFIAVISPKKHYIYYTSFNLLVVFALLLAEYGSPATLISMYDSKATKFVDMGSTYVIFVLLTLVAIHYLKESYAKEKASSDEKTAELLALNKEKIKLFSLVSHDLRGPIASIQSYLELLSQFELHHEEKTKFEQEFLEHTMHTQHLVTNLLTWSKSQMDGNSVKIVPVNVCAALQPTVKLFQGIARKKNIELNFQSEQDISILADPDMLQIVVRNLLSNAIKFTPPSGTVSVHVHTEDDYCYIEVQDSGMGIEQEQEGRLFELGSKSTYGTNNEKGVGLGLYLCKEFTEAQKGVIFYKRADNAGSIFTIRLPLLSIGAKEISRVTLSRVEGRPKLPFNDLQLSGAVADVSTGST